MATLGQFQAQPQTQANLTEIPTVSPSKPVALQALGGLATGLAGTVMGAVEAGNKAEAEVRTNTTLGNFATSLANAQQASQTDKSFDLATKQRQLFTDFSAANPAMAQDAVKIFNDTTGIKVAGLSFKQKEKQDLQAAAWDKGFGSADATPEENEKQLELYNNIQRESEVMAYNSSVDAHNKEVKLTELQNSTAKLATWKTDSLYATLEADLQTLKNGGDREALRAKWTKLSIDWSNELAQYGEFANDPTIKAQLTGIQSMLSYGKSMVDGTSELAALEKESSIAIAKQKAIVTSDPKGAQLIAVSNFFGNTPSAQLPVAKYVSEVVAKKGPSDIREVPTNEKKTARETLSNMGSSGEGLVRDEATQQVVSIAEHLDRNGMDYTDENILDVCSTIAVPAVFDNMSKEDKDMVKLACDTYVVDVAQKALRDIERDGSVSFATEVVTPRGDTRPGEPNVVPVEQFAALSAGPSGFRYAALPEYLNNRQVQRRVKDLNRQLNKVNPLLTLYAAATGEQPAYIADTLWGLTADPEAKTENVEAAPKKEPEPRPVVEVTDAKFKNDFIIAAMEDGVSADDAWSMWNEVNSTDTDAILIGEKGYDYEAAKAVLSTPAK